MCEHLHHWTATAAEPTVVVWPDGCRDLLVVVPPTGAPEVLATGLDAGASRITVRPGSVFVGIRFVAGTRFAWDEAPPAARAATRLLGEGPGAPSGMGAWARRLRQAPEQSAPLLAEALARWVRPPPAEVTEVLVRLAADAPSIAPPLLGRTLRRRVRETTGAPATFWRMLRRARRAARLLACDRLAPSDVAWRAGYADQAHLTRAMRRWFATTPAMLRRASPTDVTLALGHDTFSLLTPR